MQTVQVQYGICFCSLTIMQFLGCELLTVNIVKISGIFLVNIICTALDKKKQPLINISDKILTYWTNYKITLYCNKKTILSMYMGL